MSRAKDPLSMRDIAFASLCMSDYEKEVRSKVGKHGDDQQVDEVGMKKLIKEGFLEKKTESRAFASPTRTQLTNNSARWAGTHPASDYYRPKYDYVKKKRVDPVIEHYKENEGKANKHTLFEKNFGVCDKLLNRLQKGYP